MPYLRQMAITATQVRPGDILYPAAKAVASVERKRTRGTITLDDGTSVPVRLDEWLHVDREFLTAEEEAERVQMQHVRRMRFHLDCLLDKNPMDRIEQALDTYRNGRQATPFTAWDVEDILARQAEHLVAKCITTWAQGDMADAGSEYDALLAAIYWASERFDTRRNAPNPLSRSTNPIHNIMEDLNRYVAEGLINKLIGYEITLDDCKAAQNRIREARNAREEVAA